ncbi:hypothetical protein NG796_00425 [Laspinema sp. A4]|uniref:hypothetical protein n=1 Tax=Laspinema sp. D2d TaxID=2953686 RepID=UPI0021BB3C6C|nr:hypothetical protein [Laspinema sp. D2d]MCT7981749.1 hypothetical protein [Laspinema sp. D2d]
MLNSLNFVDDSELLELTSLGVNNSNLPHTGRSPAWDCSFWVNLRRECDRDRIPICSNLTHPVRSESLTGAG